MITTVLEFLKEMALNVLWTLGHNWIILFLGVAVAAIITVYIDPKKMEKLLLKTSGKSITGASIFGMVAFGAFTPFCACGTMAVIIPMMSTFLPWGAIMAFLTSSPLMSPDAFILYAGVISTKFALALTISSIVIGVGSGYITYFINKCTKFLDNQIRFIDKKPV